MCVARATPRNAGAVIHSHGMECVLATLLAGEDATEFRITHQEMIKGIVGACFSLSPSFLFVWLSLPCLSLV